ncbi:MAG: galactokinase [Woeseiaceae bacterium]|nr:galactokinase [Woeseiaceae bacterium]
MPNGSHNNENAASAVTRHFRAPGRINIIGEHTDYNDGFVLPTNTALYTTVSAVGRADYCISATSEALRDRGKFRLGNNKLSTMPQWLTYIAGVAAELEKEGVPLTGAALDIDGDLPIGGGLSSSASLELATARAFMALAGVDLDIDTLATVCQLAEIHHAGVNCGIMDQYSVAGGKPGAAMLLDCRSLETKFVALPDTLSMVVTDSGVKHQHPESGYNDRAAECMKAVSLLQQANSGVRALRDVNTDQLDAEKSRLGNVLYRRARHVVSENTRTLAAYSALAEGDVIALGALVRASHDSLRDDYDVSCKSIEMLIELTAGCDGVIGSRMVGGGFGGCVLSIVEKKATESVVKRIRTDYGNIIGCEPWVHVVSAAGAAGEFEPE